MTASSNFSSKSITDKRLIIIWWNRYSFMLIGALMCVYLQRPHKDVNWGDCTSRWVKNISTVVEKKSTLLCAIKATGWDSPWDWIVLMSGTIRSGRQPYHGSLWAAQAVRAHFDIQRQKEWRWIERQEILFAHCLMTSEDILGYSPIIIDCN